MGEEDKKHVFISYISEDRDRVIKLTQILERRGLTVWYDRSDSNGIGKGGDWRDSIEAAIDDAYAFIICFSKHTAARERLGILPELDRAITYQEQLPPGRTFIFPVVFDSVNLPRIRISSRQRLDSIQLTRLSGPRERQQAELGELVRALVRMSPQSQATSASGITDEESFPVSPDDVGSIVKESVSDFVASIAAILGTPQGRKRAFLSTVTFIACLLLGPLILDVVPNETIGAIEIDSESFKAVPWLLSLVGLVVIWIPRSTPPIVPETDPSISPEPTTDSQIQKSPRGRAVIAKLHQQLRSMKQREVGLRRQIEQLQQSSLQSRRHVPSLLFWSGVVCAVCCWTAANPLQGLFQKLFRPYDEYVDPVRALVLFSGSTMSAALFGIAAGWLSFRARRRADLTRFRAALLISIGAFAAGLIWLLNMTPEMQSLLSNEKNYAPFLLEYFDRWGMTAMDFATFVKLAILPAVGFVTAFIVPARRRS